MRVLEVSRYLDGGIPATSSFEVWFILWNSLDSLLLIFGVGVELRGIASSVQCIRAMEVGGTQRDSRGISHANEEIRRNR